MGGGRVNTQLHINDNKELMNNGYMYKLIIQQQMEGRLENEIEERSSGNQNQLPNDEMRKGKEKKYFFFLHNFTLKKKK